MCGCEKHHTPTAGCTCICPEHRNFEAAYDLAMRRYDEIRTLQRERDELREALHLGTELDNHHNAAACPYCRDQRAEARINAARDRLLEFIAEPFDRLEVEFVEGEVTVVDVVSASPLRDLVREVLS